MKRRSVDERLSSDGHDCGAIPSREQDRDERPKKLAQADPRIERPQPPLGAEKPIRSANRKPKARQGATGARPARQRTPGRIERIEVVQRAPDHRRDACEPALPRVR